MDETNETLRQAKHESALIAKINEQRIEIERLKAERDALRARVESLEWVLRGMRGYAGIIAMVYRRTARKFLASIDRALSEGPQAEVAP